MGQSPKIRVTSQGPKTPEVRVRSFLAVFDNSVKIEAHNLMRSLASKVAAEVKRVIADQVYDWKPLNAKYKAKKVVQGFDERTLVRSRFYLDNIEWWMSSTGVHVGVRNIIHPDAGISLNKLARIHEFGHGTTPARPHWRPAWAKVLKDYPKLRKDYYRRVRQQLAKKAKR